MLRAMNSYKFLDLGASLEPSKGERRAVAWLPGLWDGRVDVVLSIWNKLVKSVSFDSESDQECNSKLQTLYAFPCLILRVYHRLVVQEPSVLTYFHSY